MKGVASVKGVRLSWGRTRPAKARRPPPERVYISWCVTCGRGICASKTRSEVAASIGCDCPVGVDDVRTFAVKVDLFSIRRARP